MNLPVKRELTEKQDLFLNKLFENGGNISKATVDSGYSKYIQYHGAIDTSLATDPCGPTDTPPTSQAKSRVKFPYIVLDI